MEELNRTSISRRKKTGGRHAAAARFGLALTIVVWVTIMALATWLTGSRDTFIESVPAETLVYLHSQENYGLDLIRQSVGFDISPETDPDEIAAYAQLTDENKIRWTVRLRWLPILPPSEEVRNHLLKLGALPEGRLTYRLEKETEIPETVPTDRSLPIGTSLSRSLSSLLPLSKTQAVLAAGKEVGSTGLDLGLPDSIFLALFQRPGHRITAVVNDSQSLIGSGVLIGPKTNSSSGTDLHRPNLLPSLSTPSDKTVSLALPSAKELGFGQALLQQIDLDRRQYGVPDTVFIQQAREKLVGLLSGPVSAVIRNVQPEGFYFLSAWPNADPEKISAALRELLLSSQPEERDLQLPNGTTRTEFFQPQNVEINLGPYIIERESDLTLLTNSWHLLDQYQLNSKTEGLSSCLTKKDQGAFLSGTTPQSFWSGLNLLGFDLSTLEWILIQKNVNNFIHICG